MKFSLHTEISIFEVVQQDLMQLKNLPETLYLKNVTNCFEMYLAFPEQIKIMSADNPISDKKFLETHETQ